MPVELSFSCLPIPSTAVGSSYFIRGTSTLVMKRCKLQFGTLHVGVDCDAILSSSGDGLIGNGLPHLPNRQPGVPGVKWTSHLGQTSFPIDNQICEWMFLRVSVYTEYPALSSQPLDGYIPRSHPQIISTSL